MDQQSKLQEKYNTLFKNELNIFEISKTLGTMENDPDIIDLRSSFCNEVLYYISAGFIEYKNTDYFQKDSLIQLFVKTVEKLPKEKDFYWMMKYYFEGNTSLFQKTFEATVKSAAPTEPNIFWTEADIVDLFIEPIKEAYPSFWSYAQEKISPYCTKDGSHELCRLMADIYERSSDQEALDKLTEFIQKYPDIKTAREYLGCIYYNLKMWNNAIAAFESVDEPLLFATNLSQYYFDLAWCYGKIKDRKQEEEYYRKSLEINPSTLYAKNNLGYCLYLQKRFLEAKQIFEECIEQEQDIPTAANNYIRVLIALGRYKDAKSFVAQKKYKIIKTLKDKVKSLPSTNQRLKKEDSFIEIEPEEIPQEMTSALSVKGQQFSNEKLLEDELTYRIENGIPVFGKKLKMYKRKGEYGRQYIIPIGRLDLLCEDENGELYIIELKKDSGYGDAYKQTSDYLDWFAQSEKFKSKKIHGIICLNAPTDKLLEQVHKDSRMQLFEYQISYHER